jgi:formylglycine-generating enzyme required for sulfatase activity
MKKTLILILAVLSAGILSSQEKKKIAIYTEDISGKNYVEFVSEFITDAIVKRGVYKTCECSDAFLELSNSEKKPQNNWTVGKIAKLGSQLGVQLICAVKIAITDGQYFISAKLIDVNTADIKGSARPQLFAGGNSASFEEACEKITVSLFGEANSGIRYSVSSSVAVASDSSDSISAADSAFVSDSIRQSAIMPPNVEPEMVFVEGGTFTMGCTGEQGSDCDNSAKPAHRVTLSSFYIGKYEVTQAQWKALMGNSLSHFKGDSLPVENVSWNDVQKFIEQLNAATGKNYRLPAEAEWEYAARGGNMSKGYKYAGGNFVKNIVWCQSNSDNSTHPVGRKQPNELGIYDMSGNVWEWCNDLYGAYPASVQNNTSDASSGANRVYRGGSWQNDSVSCRISRRISASPGDIFHNVGFRLACSSE